MKKIHPTSLARRFFSAFCLLLALAAAAFAQTGSSVPVVNILATQPIANAAHPGVFTVFRAGDTNAALNLWYDLGGTASNGVDYAAIAPHLVQIPAGASSNTIVIAPLTNPLAASVVKTVVLTLTNSPMMTPVNYQIGWPSAATVYIEGNGVTNLPPLVDIIWPNNGAMFYAPAYIPLIANANDPDGSVTNVEFFANGADLGRGLPLSTTVVEPPGMVVEVDYCFNWQNVPTNHYTLTAVTTDNGGLLTTSAPVNITVQSPPPNQPPVVRITSPPNGAVFRAPINIPLLAYARAFVWESNVLFDEVSNLEFYADGVDLGPGQHMVSGPPLGPPGSPVPQICMILPYDFFLLWSNAPVGPHRLIAVAVDQLGNSATSAPVNITVVSSPPPPTNRPAIVSIVATDPVAIEGTNCWPWRGLASPVSTWSNWFAASATWRLYTNCGPKDATITVFRFGATNDDLDVTYAIGGTATNGIAYVALPGLVTIPAGKSRAAITIVPLDDGPPDINRTVILKLVPDTTGTNYRLGQPQAAAAIILDSQSPRAVTGLMPGAAFNLNATGPDGAWFHVESSTDLIHWTPICTNQVVNGSIDFVDPDAATNPARFYRTVPEPGPPPQ
jgi:hypothetical protein